MCSLEYSCNPKQIRKKLELSRVDLFIQFELNIRHTTLWELMLQKNVHLPSPEEGGEKVWPLYQGLKS